jgi:hypothetical protein
LILDTTLGLEFSVSCDYRTPVLPIIRKLSSFPDEKRGLELMEILNSLSPKGAAYLGRNATKIRDNARRGHFPSIVLVGPTGTGQQDLIDHGLITLTELTPDSKTGQIRYRMELTPLGVEVASLLVATDRIPTWFRDAR